MAKQLWPAWKVSLLTFFLAVGVIAALGAATMSDGVDPEKAGERAGAKYAWIAILGPVVAYIVQKVRIDNGGTRG